MAFQLDAYWVWDFWLADDGERYHMFFLHAPKALGDPDLRHRNARIGHATSTDLRTWTSHGQIFEPGPKGAFDDTANWTGCTIRDDNGLWWLFYTGSRFLSADSFANIETVGVATSPDLFTWTKQPGPVSVADPALYEVLGSSSWPEEAWRDPWVFRIPGDKNWHMLITARDRAGDEFDRGVIGHAISSDLVSWQAQPPLSVPGSGFAHLEVLQLLEIEGQKHLVFCCNQSRLAGEKAERPGGIWTFPLDAFPAPVDPSAARLIVDERLYAGRVAFDRSGKPQLLAFVNIAADGTFGGGISDPLPLTIDADGYLSMEQSS